MASRLLTTIKFRGTTHKRHGCRGVPEVNADRMGEWIGKKLIELQDGESFTITVAREDEPAFIAADLIRKELADAMNGNGDASAWLFVHRMECLVNGESA